MNAGKKTHWLVDLENVGAGWKTAVSRAEPGDEIHLFCSSNTVKIDIRQLGPASARGIRFRFDECKNGPHNAMDFQMMCELGRLSVIDPDADYVLFTADKGFSSVLDYMALRGIRVDCQSPQTAPVARTDAPPAPAKAGSVRTAYQKLLKETGLSPADQKVATAILMEAMKQPANKRKLDCRNRILKRWGKTEGNTIYQTLRDIVHKIANEGPWPEAGGAGKPEKASLDPSDKTVRAMLATARKTKNPVQSLRDQLAAFCGTREEAAEATLLLRKYL